MSTRPWKLTRPPESLKRLRLGEIVELYKHGGMRTGYKYIRLTNPAQLKAARVGNGDGVLEAIEL